jgi:Tfp pilus assembly protein PilO
MHWIAVGGLAGGLVLIIGLGWQFLLRPLGAAYEAKLAEHATLEKQLEHTKKQAAQFEKFKAQAENVRRDLDFYSRRLDPDLPAAELYSLIDGLGNSFNFGSWTFEAKPREKTKLAGLNLDEVEVTTRFEADFERLGRFLNLSVSQVRLLVPETMRLVRITDAAGLYAQTVTVELVTKVLVSPAEAKP